MASMDEHNSTPGDHRHGVGDQSPLPLAALIRAAADGEVTDAEQAQLEAASDNDSVADRIEFEQDLRAAVRRHLDPVATPADLRERIAAALASEPSAPADDVVTSPLGDTRDRSFWNSPVVATLGRWAAVAAVLAIAATLIVMASRSTAPSVSTDQASRLVGFVGSQHASCKDFGDHYKQKMEWQSVGEAHDAAAKILDIAPAAFHFEDLLTAGGYEFGGLGRCAVPNGSHSVHLIYKRLSDGTPVSLFIQTGMAPSLKLPKSCCLMDCKRSPEFATWQEVNVRYYVFSESPDVVADVLTAFKVTRDRQVLDAE